MDLEEVCMLTFGGSWVAWLMRRAADVATRAGQGEDVRPALRLLAACACAWERDLNRGGTA